jgi:general secretion pathway protein D
MNKGMPAAAQHRLEAGRRMVEAKERRRRAAAFAGLGVLALLLGAGCGERPRTQTQAERAVPTPQPTPMVRMHGADVPPIDREGAVMELDLPETRPATGGIGPFQGAVGDAAGDRGVRVSRIPGRREELVGSGIAVRMGDDIETPENIGRGEVVQLSQGPVAMRSSLEDEAQLPAPLRRLERSVPQSSETTEEFRRRVREQVERITRAAPEALERPELDFPDRNITLNFENLEIRDLILKLQEAGILPLNYILDASVQGTITIKTADPIAPEDLLDVILTILEANGLTFVRDGDYFRIVPAGQAKTFNIETYVTHNPRVVADTNEFITVIVPLEFISTQQAVSILAPFKDQNSEILEYPAGNLLFISGYSARIKRLLTILELVDIGTGREELRVFQVYYIDAEELKGAVEQILGSGDIAARVAEAQAGGRRRRGAPAPGTEQAGRQPIIIADARSNRLIVFASRRELEFIDQIIELLDQEIVVSERIYIYYVENANAAQLGSTLGAVYQTEGPAAGRGAVTPGAATGAAGQQAGFDGGASPQQPGLRNRGGRQTDPRSRTGTTQQRRTQQRQTPAAAGADRGASAADPASRSAGQVAQMQLDDLDDLDDLIEPVPARAPTVAEPRRGRRPNLFDADLYTEDQLLRNASSLVSGNVNIVADERTNALIIKTAPANWPIIKETIRKLDIQPKQVLIDVLIAEVTLDESTEFGIEWSVLSENSVGDYTFSGTTQTDFGVNNSSTGFTYTLLEATRFRGFLRAFANQNELEVLSKPHLLATNNTEASIEVGNQIPVVTQQFSGTPGVPATTGVFNSIEYRDTGILLSITPRINAANYVAMDVSQEISEAQSNTIGGTDQPIIRQRRVQTSVVVPNGQTLLIGGIMESRRDTSEQGVPWIRKLPVLRHLFGTQRRNVRKTELFIAITPHVLVTPEDADAQSDAFKESLGTQIEQMLQQGGQRRRWWEP